MLARAQYRANLTFGINSFIFFTLGKLDFQIINANTCWASNFEEEKKPREKKASAFLKFAIYVKLRNQTEVWRPSSKIIEKKM